MDINQIILFLEGNQIKQIKVQINIIYSVYLQSDLKIICLIFRVNLLKKKID